ncbi:MAG: carboxynorspermidine decarboxylase [Prolixibacteraceae bacterium]|jgi:carboxynorspermidine decarboxylase|nr:carboxynorspermidine decarboxylase [Prolixibacteraceae bacterium]
MAIDFSKVPSPCFVLDEQLLEKNLKLIASVKQRAGVEIILAFKGFAMWGAFPLVKKYIGSTTASSLNEARLANDFFGAPAHTYAPVYTQNDFPAIIKNSSHITFNSLTQFERFLPMIKQSAKNISVGLRVNPEYSEVETELYNPCAPGSRLGVTAEQLPDLLPAEIEGLHFHTLCESKSFDLEKTLQAFELKFGKYFSRIKWINMGGGHLMTHKDYDVEHLISVLTGFRQRTGLKVILEPGSAFAWETGYLISTINDIVENKGIKTAMLDVSFAAHMPDCLEMPYKPRITDSYFEPVPGKPTYRMGGNSCLSGDYVGFWSFDKELEVGDQIIFEDMIHYTMVKTTFFNGVQHPAIGTWNDTTGFKLLREFTFEDYKNKLS